MLCDIHFRDSGVQIRKVLISLSDLKILLASVAESDTVDYWVKEINRQEQRRCQLHSLPEDQPSQGNIVQLENEGGGLPLKRVGGFHY